MRRHFVNGLLTAHAKRHCLDATWKAIPEQWFWHHEPDDPLQPTAVLDRDMIMRDGDPPLGLIFAPDGADVTDPWIKVRFEREEVLRALGPQMLEISDDPPSASHGAGTPVEPHLIGESEPPEAMPPAPEVKRTDNGAPHDLSARQTARAHAIERGLTWMLAEAQKYVEEHKGSKPKREDLLKGCIAAMKTEGIRLRWEDAEEAYGWLPETYRRSRGERG